MKLHSTSVCDTGRGRVFNSLTAWRGSVARSASIRAAAEWGVRFLRRSGPPSGDLRARRHGGRLSFVVLPRAVAFSYGTKCGADLAGACGMSEAAPGLQRIWSRQVGGMPE